MKGGNNDLKKKLNNIKTEYLALKASMNKN